MSAHTPGPWKWTVESVNDEWAIVTDQHGHIIANVNSESGPDIPPVVSTKMPMRANAKFIAAAPAMYEALQQSLALVELAALEEWGRAVRGEQQPPTTEARDRLEKVKTALAQAEGCKI